MKINNVVGLTGGPNVAGMASAATLAALEVSKAVSDYSINQPTLPY
jgi:hypothetical protein